MLKRLQHPLSTDRFLRRSLLVLTMSLFLLSGYAWATQNKTYVITGRVYLPNNTPAIGAIVSLSRAEGGENRKTVTDDQGRYEFGQLRSGSYRVSASNPADPAQMTDQLETDTSRTFTGNVTLNLYLFLPRGKEKDRNGLLSVAEAAQKIPKEARKLYEKGMKAKESKQYGRARESFDQAVSLYPGYFQALTARGEAGIAENRMPEAARDFKRALALNADYEPALRGAGYCHLEAREFAAAADHFERAITLDPANASTHLLLGVARLEMGDRARAGLALRQALQLNPLAAVRAHIHLANLYAAEERYAEAVEELQVYLTALPDAPDAPRIRAAQAAMRARLTKTGH